MTLVRGATQTSYTSDGIQRASFFPAIDLLKSQFDVTDFDWGTGLRPSESAAPLCVPCRMLTSFR